MPKFLVPFDLQGNELQNAVVQNLSAAPATFLTEGRMYYNTTLHQLGIYQNGAFVYLSANQVTKSVVAAAAGIVQVSGGADRTMVDYAGGVGILKSTAAGVISAAVVGTDYVGLTSTDTLQNKSLSALNGNVLSNFGTGIFAASAFSTDGTMAGNSISTIPSQSAVVSYVASAVQGIQWKAPVRAASITAGILASSFANGGVIDGITLATGDRILLMGQATGAENGIYVVAASGAPTRSLDAQTGAEVKGMVVSVLEGSTMADATFINSNIGTTPTLGTTALTFVNFATANIPMATTSLAGKVYLSTVALAEAKSDNAKAIVASNLTNFAIKRIFTIGDGSTTSYALSHALGFDVTVSVRDSATNTFAYPDVVATSATVTTIVFTAAPASGAYKVVIIG